MSKRHKAETPRTRRKPKRPKPVIEVVIDHEAEPVSAAYVREAMVDWLIARAEIRREEERLGLHERGDH